MAENQFSCFNFNFWNYLEEYAEAMFDEDIVRENGKISKESEPLDSVRTPGNSNLVQQYSPSTGIFK